MEIFLKNKNSSLCMRLKISTYISKNSKFKKKSCSKKRLNLIIKNYPNRWG